MHYTILFDWMFELTKDPLSLTEAITYSVIYSFSRDGNGSFIASYKYLSRLTRVSERQQIRVLGKLIKEQLVIKKETAPGYPNEYKCNLEKVPDSVKFQNRIINNNNNENDEGCAKMAYPMTSHKINNKKDRCAKMAYPMTSVKTARDIVYDKMAYLISNRNININNKRLDKSSLSIQDTREEMDKEAEVTDLFCFASNK